MVNASRLNKLFAPKWQPWLGALGAVLFLFLLARPIFKDYFTRPNSMMYSFGGDALMLYYNTSYHTRYDQGSQLRSMNYPDGEYIYLTDAQGSLSNVMQWINRHVTDISGQTIGWVNAVNLYLLFAAVVLIFFVLRTLKSHVFTAILFSPLILLLSPQVGRMGGHFGLAYPFLIPMAMLWFLRKYRVGHLEKRDALMLGVSLFFTFNNPYTGFNVNFFLILAGLLLFVAEGFNWKQWKRPAIISGMGLLVLGIVFLDFKLFDPVHDRLNPQWGFFVYHATFEGMFHPPQSILYDWLTQNKIMVSPVEYEAMLNVGIITTLALAALLLITLFTPFFRKNKPTLQRLVPAHRILIGASVLLFLLAANTSLIKVSEEWMEQHMGWLLMFKASGRLGWTLYFALTITAVVFIDRLFRITSPWFMATAFSVLVAGVWNSEINQYMRPKFKEVFYGNVFDQPHEQELMDVLSQNKINIDDFQAILPLPKMIAWSDKVLSNVNFRTQFYSTRFSLATGLPMVNSMLSRIGLQHTLERVQMHANPLIERGLLKKFPNRKDILLLIGSDVIPELKNGDEFMVSISQRLVETKEYSLYRLRLSDLENNAPLEKARNDIRTGRVSAPSLHFNFDQEPGHPAFYGPGSHQTKNPDEQLGSFTSSFDRDTQMVFSAWTYIDSGKWSGGFWQLKILDENGKEIGSENAETRKSNDTQDSWIRTEAKVKLPKGGQVRIIAIGEKPMIVDEVMLWPVGATPIVTNPDSASVLYENIKINR